MTLSDGEAHLLLTAAEAASGSSLGSRDLATRLKGLADPVTVRRRRLVLTRFEARALQRLVDARGDSIGELQDLRVALAAALA